LPELNLGFTSGAVHHSQKTSFTLLIFKSKFQGYFGHLKNLYSESLKLDSAGIKAEIQFVQRSPCCSLLPMVSFN